MSARAPWLAAALLLGLAGPARAEVDWAAGLVTARGLGLADRHAPSPAAAREPARRKAEDAARAKLAAELARLPLAGGGTLRGKLGDADVKRRIDHAVALALVVESTPETDGSWGVRLAVPIEAVRQALAGPRRLPGAGDDDPAVVVVEGVRGKPAVGVTVGGVAAAVRWVRQVPDWAKAAPRVKATRFAKGAIELAKRTGGPSTLFLVIAK